MAGSSTVATLHRRRIRADHTYSICTLVSMDYHIGCHHPPPRWAMQQVSLRISCCRACRWIASMLDYSIIERDLVMFASIGVMHHVRIESNASCVATASTGPPVSSATTGREQLSMPTCSIFSARLDSMPLTCLSFRIAGRFLPQK